MNRAAAIILAAGEGRRMGTPVRKQYLPLEGIPVLARTVNAFTGSGKFCQVIVVAPGGESRLCREVIQPHCEMDSLILVEGGAERQDSVFKGLQAVEENVELVCIHDGVRPLVSEHLINSVLEGAASFGAVVPGVPVNDTLKEINLDGTVRTTLPREKVRRIQTPQAYRRELITGAYHKALLARILASDDSYLLELLDVPVRVLPGEPTNIKITSPSDLVAAAAYLKEG